MDLSQNQIWWKKLTSNLLLVDWQQFAYDSYESYDERIVRMMADQKVTFLIDFFYLNNFDELRKQ